MSHVLVGVSGGIAAYKACELVRGLRRDGHDVTVVPTAAALRFVGTTTWAALSGRPVATEVWAGADQVPHVALGRTADLVMVAPATADLLARAASGRADDLLTSVLLTARCPVVFAPAMHTEMWHHPATVANVAVLRSRGAVVVDPDSGPLTGADSGAGRLPEAAELHALAATIADRPEVGRRAAEQDLRGLGVVVSAGGTREHLDPVRFLGNASSGRMGWSLARAAALRGARVRLVAANVDQPAPTGVEVSTVVSTADLQTAMAVEAAEADMVVMAAAVADFTAGVQAETKIKKAGEAGYTLALDQTPDVLAGLVAGRTDPAQVLVGFAAETADNQAALVELGRAKLARKGCDLLVLNDVSGGRVFGEAANRITLLTAEGVSGPIAGPKDTLAHDIWDAALRRRTSR